MRLDRARDIDLSQHASHPKNNPDGTKRGLTRKKRVTAGKTAREWTDENLISYSDKLSQSAQAVAHHYSGRYRGSVKNKYGILGGAGNRRNEHSENALNCLRHKTLHSFVRDKALNLLLFWHNHECHKDSLVYPIQLIR